jgi:hypothetical protein
MKPIGSAAPRAVLVAGAVWMAAAASPVRAAMDVFVDGAGMCAGHTPCFSTIQAGVNNAGPAPATVSVFPGTYHESVDLGLMGSAIGGSPGNLTLVTVDSAGIPAHGGVNVFPATGPALINSLPIFPGTIAVDGFTVKSPDSTGIVLGTVAGLVTLGSVVSDGNAVAGFLLTRGDNGVSVFNSSFSGNLGGTGIDLVSPLGFTFDGVTADDNADVGALCQVMFGNVGVLRSSFSRNGNDGMRFLGAAGVTIDHVTADGNQGDAARISVEGLVQISHSSFTNSADDGLDLLGLTAQLTVSDATFSGNSLDGLSANPQSAQITGSRFVRNGRDGIMLFGTPGGSDFHVTCNDFIGNMTGLLLNANTVVDAAHDYWGSPTGPTHPGNPKGTGDPIVDGQNGGAGIVDFEPFLTLPVGAAEVCGPQAAPALSGSALVLSLFVLIITAALGLARRTRSNRAVAVAD